MRDALIPPIRMPSAVLHWYQRQSHLKDWCLRRVSKRQILGSGFTLWLVLGRSILMSGAWRTSESHESKVDHACDYGSAFNEAPAYN